MKVIVLGSGVIGVTSAYFLARSGHQVTVLEKNSSAGLGCSYANGCQLSYSHVETWAEQISLPTLLKTLTLPESFLSVSDFWSTSFWSWIFEFYKNSSKKKAAENSKKLFKLSSYSRKVLEQISSQEKDLDFGYKKDGILHFYQNQKDFDAALKKLDFLGSIGCKTKILTAAECVEKEPTLVKLFDEKKLIGGIFYANDASGDSFLFVKNLEKICREKYGVVFEYRTEIRNLLTNHKKITGINTGNGVFVANKYVYALGANGIGLLKGIGIDPKIYPLKGYSLSIPCNDEFVAPNLALTDTRNKVVYSHISNMFRVAGTLEFCGFRNSKNKRHIAFLKNTIKSSFADFGNLGQAEEWFGFRPFRPNSIPLICEIKNYGNLLLNTGHGSLGWTLAAASGKILSDLISDRKDKEFEFLDEEIS